MTNRKTTPKKKSSAKSAKPRVDVHQAVTDRIAEMLETCEDKWKRPWISTGRYNASPINVVSRKPYRGINVPILMSTGYQSGEWGTFDQWKKKGGEVRDEEGKVVKPGTMHVRKGEKGTQIVLFKPFEKNEKNEDGTAKTGMMVKFFTVFNADQVEGYEVKVAETPKLVERSPVVTEFLRHTLITYKEGSDSAYYSPTLDFVCMPEPGQFRDTEYGTAIEHFHSVQLHEYGHATGHKNRLDRDQTGRFGSEDYAYEELVAELTSAILCTQLGVSPTVREDHAMYIKNWLKAMKGDKKFFFRAAGDAQKAIDWMMARQPVQEIDADMDGEDAADVTIEIDGEEDEAIAA